MSNGTLLHEEETQIASILQGNGYPRSFVQQVANERKRNVTVPTSRRNEPHSMAKIPFVNGVTQPIQRILSRLNISTIQCTKPWKWYLQRNVKDSLPPQDSLGVVYRIDCTQCDKSYIGETKRSTRIRVKEHMASARNGHPEVSAAAEHALIYDHSLAWEKATPINHARNTRQRLVKEALWIHSLEGKLMNRDHGIELNPLWLELIRSD